MPANLENSAVATGLEKVSFHSNPKERQCQRMFKTTAQFHSSHTLVKWCSKFTRLQQFMNFQMFKLDLEKAEEPEIKLPTSFGSSKKQENSRKTSTSALYTKAFDCADHNKLWKILQDMGIPEHLTSLLRSLYACQESTVRTGHGTTDWFQIGKGVRQGCILSPCLFNLYAEYIMRNTGLEEAKAGIKIAGRNINNFWYADDTTLNVKTHHSEN